MGHNGKRSLILASGSETRRKMLQAAGLEFEIIRPVIDEVALRRSLEDDDEVEPEDVAELLASFKAEAVSKQRPDALVIGADQILAVGDEIIHKAADLAQARDTLAKLRGIRHELHSAVAVAANGGVVWTDVDTASLHMRKFSEDFVSEYLARAGEGVLHAVGCYEFEGLGAQLFERVSGDYFTILGLPLLPLLGELRKREVLVV